MTSSVIAAIDNDYSEHVMLCLKPPEDVSKVLLSLPDETEETLDDAHITLIYLGTTDDLGGEPGRERLYRACYDWAIHCGWSELSGYVGGFGLFLNETKVLYASWDVMTIERFVTGLGATLVEHGISIEAHTHGYTAHQTLAYYEPDEDVEVPQRLPDGLPETIQFEGFYIAWADDPWQLVPLR